MRLAALAVMAAMLAACGRPDVVAEEEDVTALPLANNASASPTGGPPDDASITNSTRAAPGTIPAALQGRWALTPRDCTAPLEDARGLLVINSEELRFYESRAVPTADVQTSAGSISGDFAFIGEGQQWTKHQSLDLRGGELVRTERDPLASFRYVRC